MSNPFTIRSKNERVKKKNRVVMLLILFAFFIFFAGIAVGSTYSGFQSTAESNGTLTFAVNGHRGTLSLANTKVAEYESTDLLLEFTLASDTNYTSPTISGITMGGVALTESSGDFKTSTNVIVATYSAPILTINRANVSGDLVITGGSNASTYTITYNSNGGTGTMSNSTLSYNSVATLRANTFTRMGYTFWGWALTSSGEVKYVDQAEVKDLGSKTLYAKWLANELNFDNQSQSKSFSTVSQNITFTGASAGTGSYSYSITAGNDEGYFSVSGTTITAVASTPIGMYNVAITATDTGSSKTRTAIIAITINPITLGTPVVSVSTAGVVTWEAITGASSYDISIDGTTWTTGVSSGLNYFSTIVAGTGSRTVLIRANPSANYDASKIGTSTVIVYAVTIARNNNSYGTVSASSRNVISGATVSVSNNVLYFEGGQGVTPTATSATGYDTTFTSWSKTSGTITSAQTITATFTRTAKTYTVTSGKSGYTNTLTVAASGTFDSGLSISWSAGSATGYTYSLSHVKVYSGSNTSGTLLATFSSGTSGTFTMNSTTGYYSSIYVYVTHTRSANTYTVTSGKSSCTELLAVAASGTFDSGLSISWSAGSATGYTYSFSHVKVYSGTNTSGTLLATYTSGTSATFTMSGTYYSSIYVYATHTRSAISYSIIYNYNGGSASNPANYTVETNTFTLNNPTLTGYTFTGWSGSSSGMSITITKGSTGNKSFTANWSENSYTFNISLSGSSYYISPHFKVNTYLEQSYYTISTWTSYTSTSISVNYTGKLYIYVYSYNHDYGGDLADYLTTNLSCSYSDYHSSGWSGDYIYEIYCIETKNLMGGNITISVYDDCNY